MGGGEGGAGQDVNGAAQSPVATAGMRRRHVVTKKSAYSPPLICRGCLPWTSTCPGHHTAVRHNSTGRDSQRTSSARTTHIEPPVQPKCSVRVRGLHHAHNKPTRAPRGGRRRLHAHITGGRSRGGGRGDRCVWEVDEPWPGHLGLDPLGQQNLAQRLGYGRPLQRAATLALPQLPRATKSGRCS